MNKSLANHLKKNNMIRYFILLLIIISISKCQAEDKDELKEIEVVSLRWLIMTHSDMSCNALIAKAKLYDDSSYAVRRIVQKEKLDSILVGLTKAVKKYRGDSVGYRLVDTRICCIVRWKSGKEEMLSFGYPSAMRLNKEWYVFNKEVLLLIATELPISHQEAIAKYILVNEL